MSISISINLLGVFTPLPLPLSLSPHIHIFWPVRLTKCLSYLFMPFTSESDGEGDDQTKNLFIEVFTVNYTFSMWIKMSTRSPSLYHSLSVPLSASLSGVIIHTSSSWPTMAWLRLAFILFLFGLSLSWQCPCPALPVGFIAMQTAPNGCV